MIEFDVPDLALILGLVIAIGLPVLVGLVTKVTTNSSVKAILLAALSVGNGVLVEWVANINAGEVFNAGTALTIAFFSFISSVAIHFGLLKPTGVSAAVQKVGS
jgi:hypothetical protein